MSEQTETKKIADLIPDDLNANKGREIGRDKLRRSIEKHGFGRSVLLDKNGKLIAGNKTVEEALKLGYTDVVVVRTKGKQLVAVQRDDIDLDTKDGRDLAIADNRVSEANLAWDIDNLRKIATATDESVITDFWSEKELEVLENKFKEVKEKDESGMDKSAEKYKSNSILNIVLYFEASQYGGVLADFDRIADEMECYDKSELVVRLIEFYKERRNK
jgi:hypothetical protein